MGLLGWLTGKRRKEAARSSVDAYESRLGPPTRNSTTSATVRRDLLRVVLRETLFRSGIPSAWIGCDILKTSRAQQEPALHVRFLVRHWDARLMLFGVALQKEFMQRLLLLDPGAETWTGGFSWQFALEDDAACPPLPHPGTWTGETARRAAPPSPTEPGADVIAGPVRIGSGKDARGNLEKLLAQGDEDMRRHAQGGDIFAATRPISLDPSRPAPLEPARPASGER